MTKLRNALLLIAVAAPLLGAQTTTPKNASSVPNGDADNGIHAATMLMRGVTPRAVALGEAMGAVEGDPSTFFYNTAGIARIKTNSFLVTGIISGVALSFIVHEPSGIIERSSARSLSASRRR